MTTHKPQLPAAAAAKADTRSKPLKVTGKLKVALEGMTLQGLTRAEAAKSAGITDHALYCALRKPHVAAEYHKLLEVLRTSARAQNFHALERIRDQPGNPMAAVAAIRQLEQAATTADPAAKQRTPGIVIVIGSEGAVGRRVGTPPAPSPLVIEHAAKPQESSDE